MLHVLGGAVEDYIFTRCCQVITVTKSKIKTTPTFCSFITCWLVLVGRFQFTAAPGMENGNIDMKMLLFVLKVLFETESC